MQNRNIYPYIVKGKASKKDGSCPIYITIHIDKQVAAFFTKKKVVPKDWDEQKKLVKAAYPMPSLFIAPSGRRLTNWERFSEKKCVPN